MHELQTLYTIRTFNFIHVDVFWDISTCRRFCYELFGKGPSDLHISTYGSEGVKYQNNWSNIYNEIIVYYLSLVLF